MPTPITIFRSPSALKSFETGQLTRQLIEQPDIYPEKKAMRLLKLATFGRLKNPKGNLRHDANVLALHGIEVDYDNNDGLDYSPEKAAEVLEAAGVIGVIYTSPSHTKAKPRWRGLFPFAQPYVGTTRQMRDFRNTGIDALERLLACKFSPESRTLSQTYYYGRVKGTDYWTWSGGELPIDRALPQMVFARDEPDQDTLDIEFTLAQLQSGANYHQSLVSLAGHHVAKGVALDEVVEVLETAMRAIPADERRDEWESRYAAISNSIVPWFEGKEPKLNGTHAPEGLATALNPVVVPLEDLSSRPRIYGDYLLRGYLSMINGPGGVSKSVWTLVLGLGLAIGRDLLGISSGPVNPRRVLMVNNEDPADELWLRLYAIRQAYNLTEEEWALALDNLMIHSGYENRVMVSVNDDNHRPVRHEMADHLVAFCRDNEVDALVMDPLVSLHQSSENDNVAMDAVIAVLREIAAQALVAILFAHHVRKGSAPGSVDDNARGASSLIAAVRAAYGLSGMTEQEAEKFALPEGTHHGQYVRLDSGKRNYAPRAVDATWFFMESVELFVQDWETGEPASESIGVPTPVDLEPAPEETGAPERIPEIYDACGPKFTVGGHGLLGLQSVFGRLTVNPIKERLAFFPEVGESPLVFTFEEGSYSLWRSKHGQRIIYHIDREV